ncbi:spore maturation protein CgeB [Methylobacterium gossipiicola]|uniref:Spore maturation protein CgeB n=1 Tax=Methylobacterium gossipiicola TaxID=582675 RepID=A0A1I2WT16_9HYPH|nr:spore maturation protein CgeB [Methylobacterium gossipiicola]
MNFHSGRGVGRQKVLVTSTFQDGLNTNAVIRPNLAEGFTEILGADTVKAVPLDLAPGAIRQFRPDLVVAVGSIVPDASDLRGLRRAADGVGAELALWLTDDPYEFDYAFKAELTADIIFSNDSWAVHHYRHGNVHHLPLAASRTRHFRALVPVAEREHVVFFCGVAYPNRVALIRRADALLSRHPVAILGADWPSDIRCAANRRLSPAEMADHAAGARLTLNIGRDLDIANRRFALPPATPGPRTFEVALAGSAQLYFATGLEICDLFEPGREILLVDGVADIARAIEQALDDPAAIQAVAARAQARALREHTYAQRAARILALCRSTAAMERVSERPRLAVAGR